MGEEQLFASKAEKLYLKIEKAQQKLNEADDPASINAIGKLIIKLQNELQMTGNQLYISKANEIINLRKFNKQKKNINWKPIVLLLLLFVLFGALMYGGKDNDTPKQTGNKGTGTQSANIKTATPTVKGDNSQIGAVEPGGENTIQPTEELKSTETPVPSNTKYVTPTKQIIASAATNTPTPTKKVNTPTPTKKVNTPTPTKKVNTPTPTKKVNTPTPTPTTKVNTPTPTKKVNTPTPTKRVNTPTPTKKVNTPTPTPTPIYVKNSSMNFSTKWPSNSYSYIYQYNFDCSALNKNKVTSKTRVTVTFSTTITDVVQSWNGTVTNSGNTIIITGFTGSNPGFSIEAGENLKILYITVVY
ncbi:MAG: hypothetical protein PUB67_07580 [Clostridiales bacterium]|nr:hypothetical protein [Clostridiales bacterium]